MAPRVPYFEIELNDNLNKKTFQTNSVCKYFKEKTANGYT